MPENISIHLEYGQSLPGGEISQETAEKLAGRRDSLRKMLGTPGKPGGKSTDREREIHTFPVLSILAPVMSTHEEKIEFPGDPMCLYAALSYAVDQAVTGEGYNDLRPGWHTLPTRAYRLAVDTNGIRKYDGVLNTDQTVFDPRVWNAAVKEFFVTSVLGKMRPKVALISAVSPAHRYALEIARTIRATLPGCIIVLGGRHADETAHFNFASGQVELEPSGPLRLMLDSKIDPVFDFIVSGQGYYALDLLMKVTALAMDVETKAVSAAGIVAALSEFAPLFRNVRGHALIVGLAGGEFHAWPVSGATIHLDELPSPYKAFAIRAHFPVFVREGRVLRTAHMMVTNSCPFHCYFCSESSSVVGEFLTFKAQGLPKAIARMLEYVSYGAEAIFFDNSIFWGGNIGHIMNFCQDWMALQKTAWESDQEMLEISGYRVNRADVLQLKWGAQVTVDFLASRRFPEETLHMLTQMRLAGCTYLYMGIESMSAEVIQHVHKNTNAQIPWDERVRAALGMARMAGIQVGSSILFGLDGETQATIEDTIQKVEELVSENLVMIASPNILTYHPNTAITREHGMREKIDYHSANLDNRPPYVYFEEAFPAVVSKNLSEDQFWYIHQQTGLRWGSGRNSNPMPPTILPEEQ